MWREGDGPLGTGATVIDTSGPHFAQPVTVVRDDTDALVVWLPIGTPVLRAARADGLGKRDDPSTLFTAELVKDRGCTPTSISSVSPTGRPWSVWVFFTEGTGEFAGWYVNLEKPHVRDEHTAYTSDHVLDLVISRDRTMVRKDEDERALAVVQGVFDATAAAATKADAAAVEAVVADWGHRSVTTGSDSGPTPLGASSDYPYSRFARPFCAGRSSSGTVVLVPRVTGLAGWACAR